MSKTLTEVEFAISCLKKGTFTIARGKLIDNIKKTKVFNQKTKDMLYKTYLYDRLEELENGPCFGLFGLGRLGAIQGIKENILEFERKHK